MATAEQEIEAPARARRPSFWDQFIGKRLCVQTKGRVIITGDFVEHTRNGFVVLGKPIVKGISVKTRPPQVFIDRAQIGHFHEECETEQIKASDGEN